MVIKKRKVLSLSGQPNLTSQIVLWQNNFISNNTNLHWGHLKRLEWSEYMQYENQTLLLTSTSKQEFPKLKPITVISWQNTKLKDSTLFILLSRTVTSHHLPPAKFHAEVWWLSLTLSDLCAEPGAFMEHHINLSPFTISTWKSDWQTMVIQHTFSQK